METPIDVDKIIRDLGGSAKVAELCGIGTVQAVSMWSARKKIPKARLMFLKLARPDIFGHISPELAIKGDTDDAPRNQAEEETA